MSRALAIAALLAITPALCAAADPPLESPAECIARLPTNTPATCLVMRTTLRFIVCQSSMSGMFYGLKPDDAQCATKGVGSFSDYYEATMKSFEGNQPAQSMTKDYYAFWLASMGSLMPGSERRTVWDARINKMQFDLNQMGTRLKLEK